jgi:hypothetical protein
MGRVMKNGNEAGSARAPIETGESGPGRSAPSAKAGESGGYLLGGGAVPHVHFTREDLAIILAERLGISIDPGGELAAFWNVTVDGDFRGVTVWL